MRSLEAQKEKKKSLGVKVYTVGLKVCKTALLGRVEE